MRAWLGLHLQVSVNGSTLRDCVVGTHLLIIQIAFPTFATIFKLNTLDAFGAI